jgi:hypothetical protein
MFGRDDGGSSFEWLRTSAPGSVSSRIAMSRAGMKKGRALEEPAPDLTH